MGGRNSGRRPKPTKLKLLTGNPGKRELNADEPQFTPADDLEAPKWMKGPALEEWNRIVTELSKLGMLSVINTGALTGLCVLFGNAIRASRTGNASEARNSWDGYRKYCNDFGLTPASAGRVKAGTNPDDEAAKDPLTKYTKRTTKKTG